MRVVLQRVKHANVRVDNALIGSIDKGYLLLVGITHEDQEETVRKLARKCVELRLFEDENGKMNLGLSDVHGEILSISQFTLYADCRRGRRPGFTDAARPQQAEPLYALFNQTIEELGIHVETGKFGADMKVELLNDGPVTILLDSGELCREAV